MTVPKFVQFHYLHTFSAALLNRDDSGMAKKMPFGGTIRTRISSQCLKRHWRTADDDHALQNIEGAERAIRSRSVVERSVIGPLRNSNAASDEVLTAVQDAFNVGLYGERGTSRDGRQLLMLGNPEVRYLAEKAKYICENYSNDENAAVDAVKNLFVKRGEGDNFRAFRDVCRLPGGLDGAMFGRMVTSDPKANIYAAVHVAHAMTVHEEEHESDYFSVMDDLVLEDESSDESGAAHIGDMELTSGIYYGYVVVDVPTLVSNIEGCRAAEWMSADRTLASKVTEHLMHLIAKVTPGAKLGPTAPYSRARLMYVEMGKHQPYKLSEAFREPVAPTVRDAMRAMTNEITKNDMQYGKHGARGYMSMEEWDCPDSVRYNLDDLGKWVAGAICDGKIG